MKIIDRIDIHAWRTFVTCPWCDAHLEVDVDDLVLVPGTLRSHNFTLDSECKCLSCMHPIHVNIPMYIFNHLQLKASAP